MFNVPYTVFEYNRDDVKADRFINSIQTNIMMGGFCNPIYL